MTKPHVIVADDPLARARGAVGRDLGPDDLLVLDFGSVGKRLIWMLGVRQPLDVAFLANGTVQATTVLEPWTGWAYHRANVVLEAVAGSLSLSEGESVNVSRFTRR